MPTNEEMRRASGLAMQNSRRAIGQSMEDQRRAGGQAMIAQRTGKAVVADINVLTNPQQPRKTLKPIASVGALPATKGRGVYKPPAATGTGGIASPLIEGASGEGATLAREYYAGITLTSSDGLISLDVEPLKKLTMRDASGGPAVLEFAEP